MQKGKILNSERSVKIRGLEEISGMVKNAVIFLSEYQVEFAARPVYEKSKLRNKKSDYIFYEPSAEVKK